MCRHNAYHSATKGFVSFAATLRETEAEARGREATVARLEDVLNDVHPGARAHVFGSCITGLRLPYGDVDLMVEYDTFMCFLDALACMHWSSCLLCWSLLLHVCDCL